MSIINQFKIHLIEDGKSDKTIQSYVGDIEGFEKYLISKGAVSIEPLKRFYITSYKDYLVENNYEPATINKKINSIQSFNNFLIEKGLMTENIIDLRKDRVKVASGSEHKVEVFSERQVERNLFYAQNEKKVSLRDKMIIHLLMFTGVKASELCDIKIKNIDFLTG